MLDVASWWRVHVPATADAAERLVVVESRRHPDGTCLELTAEEAAAELSGERLLVTLSYDEHGRAARIDVAPEVAPKAPPLWLGEIRESSARPPATNLVAFSGFGVGAGSLLDEAALAQRPVASADQLGAVRWYPATGEIDQIYVAPSARRRGIATMLLVSAATLSVARSWPRLWTDGQRTVMGEQLRESRAWRGRAAELTHVAPPMTPGEV